MNTAPVSSQGRMTDQSQADLNRKDRLWLAFNTDPKDQRFLTFLMRE